MIGVCFFLGWMLALGVGLWVICEVSGNNYR